MRQKIIALVFLFLFLLAGCRPYSPVPAPTTEPDNISISVEDCSALTKRGNGKLLKNNNQQQDYRAHFGLGTCHTLLGHQTVVLFFVDDDESCWSSKEIDQFTQTQVLPALNFLQTQAAAWGVELSFSAKRYSTALSGGISFTYDGSVIQDLSISGSTKDLPQQVANILDCSNEMDLLASLIMTYGTDAIIPLMLINKSGTSYARNQISAGNFGHMEHAVIFSDSLDVFASSDRQVSTIAHETLHLFGVDDYYSPHGRLQLAEQYYIDDIMLLDTRDMERLKIDAATAYYIGWTDNVPVVCYLPDWNE